MKKKKVVYQITRKKYRLVEVDTGEQAELVKELNRDFEREDKRAKALWARYQSLEELAEQGEIIKDDSPDPEETLLQKERLKQMKVLTHKALKKLSPRQQEIVRMAYFEEKSQAEIARELGITEGSVSITLERAKVNLRKILEKSKKFL